MQCARHVCVIIGVFFVVLFISGCSTVSREPVMMDPILLEQQPTTISILPTIDARRDRESVKMGKLCKYAQGYSGTCLKVFRKYEVVLLDNYAVNHPEGYLAEMTDEELVALAPDNVEAAFLVVMDDLTSDNKIISQSARVICRAYLIDPAKKKIIWKDEEASTSGGAGLAYAFIPMKKSAIESSLRKMTESLPKRGSRPQ